MQVSTLLGTVSNTQTAHQQGGGQVYNGSTGPQFAGTLAQAMSGVTISNEQLRSAFSTTKTADAFAHKAASFGLNAAQIQHAMQLCGYGSSDPSVCKAEIQNWVANPDNGYTWSANGTLTEVQSKTMSLQRTSNQNSAGITLAGHFLSMEQIKDFYSQGGNVNEVMQRHGITNPWEIGAINAQASQLSGVRLTEQENLQNYFKQYQKYNPNGKYANDFAGFARDQDPLTKMNMEIGQYTGPVTALADFEPGGIYGPGSIYYGKPGYGSGLGPRGIGNLGGGWDQEGAASTSLGT